MTNRDTWKIKKNYKDIFPFISLLLDQSHVVVSRNRQKIIETILWWLISWNNYLRTMTNAITYFLKVTVFETILNIKIILSCPSWCVYCKWIVRTRMSSFLCSIILRFLFNAKVQHAFLHHCCYIQFVTIEI